MFCKEWSLLFVCAYLRFLRACQLKRVNEFVYAWLPWCWRDLHSKLDYAQLYLWHWKSFNLKCFCMEVQRKARLPAPCVCVQVARVFICKCKILSAAASRVLYYSCCRWISELGAFWSAIQRAHNRHWWQKCSLCAHTLSDFHSDVAKVLRRQSDIALAHGWAEPTTRHILFVGL